jgi:hypothetical protein
MQCHFNEIKKQDCMENCTVTASPEGRANLAGAIIVASVIGLWLLTPPLIGTYKAGTPAIFRFFLQDTFYYLSVAANSTTGFYTFDGQTPTTGFHPLWQVYLTRLFELAPHDQTFQIHLVFWVSVLGTTLGYILAGLAVYNVTKSKLLGVLIVPGFFNLMFSFVFQFAGSPWSFMNGMESPLTVLFGGMLFVLLSVHYNAPEAFENRKSFHLAMGIVLSLVFLSRLDDIFVVAAFALCVLIPAGRPIKAKLTNAALMALPTAVVMSVYLGFNFYNTHMFLPISGTMKSGIAIWDNLDTLFNAASLKGIGTPFIPVAHLSHLYRQIQALFPPLVAIFFVLILVTGTAKESINRHIFLIALLVYICLKAFYNEVNVHADYQGVVWYFVLSMLAINFVGLVLLSKAYWRFCEFSKPVKAAALVAIMFYLGAHLNIITMITISGNTLEYNFWNARSAIASDLQKKDQNIKILEYEDGIINYALRIPTMHGIGFVVDRGAYEAKQRMRMLDYAYRHGYNTIGSLVYVRLPNERMTSAQIEQVLGRSPYFRGENVGDFTYKVLLIHKQTGATFIKFERKEQLP